MTASIRYQVMPPLASDEYQELYEDIRQNGVLVPVLEDEDGVIIDGHHRSRIASELGIPCPVETISGKSDEEKRGMAFTLNLKRRHLNREQRRALIAESLKADPQLSNREHARRTGADKNTVGSVRDAMEESGEIHHFSNRVDPRTGNATQPASQPPRREPVEPEPEEPREVPKPRASVLPQADLDELNTPTPQPDTELEPEPAPAREPEPVHQPPEMPDTQRDHLLDLMAAIRNAEKALRDALLAAHRVTKWDGETPTQQLRETLDEIDQALAADDLDTELQNLLGGNNA